VTSKLVDFEGMYELMNRTFPGNWQYRMGATPYGATSAKAGKRESIAGHMWMCMVTWMQMKVICPALAKLVNSEELYEILMVHDLGETVTGDVSNFQQLQGHGVGKEDIEREEIRMLTDCLPEELQSRILTLFEGFEAPLDQITQIEYLVAKFIDIVEGDQFALAFGNDLPQYAVPIQAILDKKFKPRALRLITVLKQRGFDEAAEEVRLMSVSHADAITKAGVPYSF
jgi:5'-deoxynucleotidase YfbR-like HD superfamily hydrolase